jgi:membrane-bound ClpP family serine protease
MVYLVPIALAVLGGPLWLAFRSRRQKRTAGDLALVSSSALVTSALSPDGAVLVQGELFFARSQNGNPIPASTPVKVVGVSQHLLLVEESFKA